MYKANTNIPKERNRHQYDNSRGFNNPLTSIEITHRQKIEHMPLNDKLDKMDLTEIKHSIQQQHKMHFFPVCMEHSPG